MPGDLAAKVIEHKHFEPAAFVILQEEKFLPDREVPIAVDLPLRFKRQIATKTELILTAYHRVAQRIWQDAHGLPTVYSFLFFASHPPHSPSKNDRQTMKHGLLKFFSKLTNNQLNYVCDIDNKLVYETLIEIKDELVDKKGVAALTRLYFVLGTERTKLLQELRSFEDDPRGIGVVEKNTLAALNSKKLKNLFTPTPGLISNRKKLKVAICISGQLRGYKEAFPSWSNALRFEEIEPHFLFLCGRK